MKNILLAFLFLFSFKAHSQVLDTLPWAPKGATWLYSGGFIGGYAYDKFVYTSDTTILNKKVKKISKFTFVISQPTPDYLPLRGKESFVKDYFYYASNDSVYWFNKNQFDILYVFNAKVGDSWKINKNSDLYVASIYKNQCTDSFKIDSNTVSIFKVDNVINSNKSFTTLYSTGSQFWDIGFPIIKNIGALNAPLYPKNGNKCSYIDQDMGVPSRLTCYYDSLRGYIIGGSDFCHGLITSNSDLKSIEQNFHISPNPVNSILHVENNFDNAIKSIKIYNLMGREFISIQNYSNTDINVAHLPNGMYVLKALTVDNNFISSKFVKTE